MHWKLDRKRGENWPPCNSLYIGSRSLHLQMDEIKLLTISYKDLYMYIYIYNVLPHQLRVLVADLHI